MKNKTFYLFLGISLGFLLSFSAVHLLNDEITNEAISKAANIIGLNFTEAERDSMIEGLADNREKYKTLRSFPLKNSVPPALIFNPVPVGNTFNHRQKPVEFSVPDNVPLPDDKSKLAFYPVTKLASLIKDRKISSVELTKFFLERLKRYDDTLHAVVTLTEELALEQARKMDAELANGNYRGPLHGIPYTLKDLLAVKGYKTTWGATPYKNQMINKNATVYKRLKKAGAVLVAKTSLGALAYGDVWFGGKTRNPWNLEQGSSGSSAGPAAVTAAGLAPFSIGTETWGSIVSPSTRTGVTGLRPTFGRVSRYGAMALSWTMDKIGPITHTVEEAAIVFNAIYGPDGQDQSLVDLPFNYDGQISLDTLTIGYVKAAFEEDYPNKENDQRTLKVLRDLGADLVPIELPDIPVYAMTIILNAEAAAAFNQLTLSNQDSLLVRQGENAWPNIFRTSRFIPAVEYILANRVRYKLIQKMYDIMQKVDVYVAPSFGRNLLLTNLTGHPAVVLPNGFDEKGGPTGHSITFIGGLYDEGTLLEVAKVYQQATGFHKKHPGMFTKKLK